MKISATNEKPNKKKTDVLAAFLFEKLEPLGLGQFENKFAQTIKDVVKENKGKEGQISVIHLLEKTTAKRIMLVGIGNKRKCTAETIRNAAGNIVQKTRDLGLNDVSIIIPEKFLFSQELMINAVVEGAVLSQYSFDKFKKDKKQGAEPNVSILVSTNKNFKNVINTAQKVSEGVNFARGVANLPPNQCPPAQIAKIAKSLTKNGDMKCTVFSKNELNQKKFGGISAVGKGSKNEPKLIILEHKMGKKQDKPIVIVGKAVTFDTGGISLKPGLNMDEMKFDKCGGCNVLGIMKAVSDLKLPLNVIGIIPSVENMPGGESYRPGDIIKLFNGKTAEILNTDAEGRLILSDALSYGIKMYSPRAVIDFATLTGACIIALGTNVAGMMSNNKKLSQKIIQSSDHTSERIWQLPLDDDFIDMIKSDVADMKNIGIGRAAGTITAAAFLAKSVDNTPWVHIDIAGTAWDQVATKKRSYNPKGATGFGVRLILDYLKNQSN